uniref:Uncharacterized protein n=1 Tax=Cucumis melo TaxID=3656 RepID=A0A9I9EH74_CUCME
MGSEGKGRGKLASDREGFVTCHMGTQFCFRVNSSGVPDFMFGGDCKNWEASKLPSFSSSLSKCLPNFEVKLKFRMFFLSHKLVCMLFGQTNNSTDIELNSQCKRKEMFLGKLGRTQEIIALKEMLLLAIGTCMVFYKIPNINIRGGL